MHQPFVSSYAFCAYPDLHSFPTRRSSDLAELIERNCHQARRFAEGLKAAGHTVLNEVVLNQVLVAFGDSETTNRVISERSEEHTSELQSLTNLVCRLLLEKKN